MSLRRKIRSTLKDWKTQPNRPALLVTGARQIGKTYSIREFGTTEYDCYLEINFIETPSAMAIFEGDLDARTLIASLTAFSDRPLVPGKTLIFLDEIQECPRARTAMKFLVEDGRFDYIESGSLLGVQYKEVPSYPVGYERIVRMYPLSLEEFYWAIGVQQETLDLAWRATVELREVPEAIHARLLKAFCEYVVVGGMPAAVSTFLRTQDMGLVKEVQGSILDLYKQDIAKYGTRKAHIRSIFEFIPAELDKKNKRFKLSDLAKTARMEHYASDFIWLADAGVALPCYNVTAPVAPLAINTQHNLFKLYLCDIGLLAAQVTSSERLDLLQGRLGVNWGSILENAIAQELAAHGISLHYFDKSKYGEVDFLVEEDATIVPIEVKSGNDFRAHKALTNIMDVDEWQLGEAVVLCKGNVGRAGNVTYLPWYAAMFMRKDPSEAKGV